MPAQIIFLTLYLGLIGGPQPVQVQVGSNVKLVRFLLDGRDVGISKSAPWSIIIDFGRPFEPHELIAVAFDRDGDEAGRISQLINLPRPAAELSMDLQTDGKGTPLSVALRWEQVYASDPSLTTVSVDGKSVNVDAQFHALLPKLDAVNPHVIAAEMRFVDGSSARREMVIAGGAISDSISTELTPVLFTGKPPAKNPMLEGCFAAGGVSLRTAAVETPEAQIFLVREPHNGEATAAIDPDHYVSRRWQGTLSARHRMPLDPGTSMRYTWPIVHVREAAGHIASNIFEVSAIVTSKEAGMAGVLTMPYDLRAASYPLHPVEPGRQRRFADAVAVAGLNAVTNGHRRAIILIVDCFFDPSRDRSNAEPEAVRRYLESVGVPLFVWSVSGPRPDLEAAWGDIDDISTPRQFQAAAQRLRDSLAAQHIAWVASDPLTALRATAAPRCGITPLAHLGH